MAKKDINFDFYQIVVGTNEKDFLDDFFTKVKVGKLTVSLKLEASLENFIDWKKTKREIGLVNSVNIE